MTDPKFTLINLDRLLSEARIEMLDPDDHNKVIGYARLSSMGSLQYMRKGDTVIAWNDKHYRVTEVYLLTCQGVLVDDNDYEKRTFKSEDLHMVDLDDGLWQEKN